MTDVECIYDKVGEAGTPCPWKGSETMMGHHIRKDHIPNTVTKKEEPNPKRIKRMEAKPPRFKESET